MIEPCASPEQAGWLSLRRALWPEGSDAEHLAEMAEFLAVPQRFAQFVAYDAAGQALGFIEASIRSDYVNGTQSSPAAFLEGIYVLPAHRRSGVARSLFEAVAAWALAQGVQEIASDAAIDNTLSHQVHQALGFVETERVVYFRQVLHCDGG
jgi:aminoglycoside 6'-N-acetyltransferase I